MNPRDIWVVFSTDLVNTLRDRRTWLAMIVVPLLMVPLLLVVAPSAMEGQREKLKASPPEVAVVGEENAPDLLAFLRRSDQVRVVDTDDAAAALEDGDVKAVLRITPDLETAVAQGRSGEVSVEFDASSQVSEITSSRLQALVSAYSQSIVAERLARRGLDPSILTPVITQVRNVAPEEKVAGYFLALVMPMMLAIWAALGGMYAAIDGVAGEKERGTLEPLLATPPNRSSLVAGKYLTVVLTSVVASGIALLGMYIAFLIKPESLIAGEAGMKFSIPLANALLILGTAVLLAAFFSALELALSAFARSFREAQSYLSPMSVVVVIPGLFTQFVEPSQVSGLLFYIPLVNGIFVFKEALMNAVDWGHVAVTAASSLVWIVVALRFASAIFRKESVLFRT